MVAQPVTIPLERKKQTVLSSDIYWTPTSGTAGGAEHKKMEEKRVFAITVLISHAIPCVLLPYKIKKKI